MTDSRHYVGELIAEFIAVLIIIFFGDSVAAMIVLYDPNPYLNSYWGVAITWGLGVTIAIYATGAVSGTHANPAITVALATFRGFPWKKVAPYIVAQVLGGMVGAAIVYQMYGPVIDNFNQAHHLSRAIDGGAAGVFFTSPGAGISVWHAFTDQIIQTAVLAFGIFAITCRFNTQAPQANAGALIIGLLVAIIGASCGNLEAWALNPARDFGPRLFCYLAGWDHAALPGLNNYWWVPILGPIVGALVGGGLYRVGLQPFMPNYVVTPGVRPITTDTGNIAIVARNDGLPI